MQWACPTKRNQREVFWIVTTFDRDGPYRPRHRRVHHPHNPQCRIDLPSSGTDRNALDCRCGARCIEVHVAPQKRIAPQPSQNDIRIGDGGQGTNPVAGWTRRCSCTLWSDPECPCLVETGNRAAACAHGVDVEAGYPDGQAAHRRAAASWQIPITQRDIRRCAAHIEGDAACMSDGLGHAERTDNPPCRPR